ncbi:tripartite tricarboxylate transporter TctB family protein [Mycetocola sp. 2940]|uniref:tripartite tricarboxylate transporter TctB family protein n=1 Tax=Mycetocola sp. 2940 TaxID=3156452 RepID=UPI00339A6B95
MESVRLKVAGIAFTAVLAAVGIAAVIGGLMYGVFAEDGLIGPGFLPVMSGGLVALFAISDIISRLLARKHPVDERELLLDDESAAELEAEAKVPDIDIFGRSQKQRNKQLIAVIGILIATVALVEVLGFILAFGIMLVVTAVLVERRKLLPSILVAVIALGVAYLVFGVLLRVPLPQGLFGMF